MSDIYTLLHPVIL